MTTKQEVILFSSIALVVGGYGVATVAYNVAKPKSEQASVVSTPKPYVFKRSKLLAETNKKRTEPLIADAALNKTAQAKCEEIVRKDDYNHGDLEPYRLMAGRQMIGENLVHGRPDEESTVAAWMDSPPHREAIVSNQYTRVGFGVCEFHGGILVVQHLSDTRPAVQGMTTPQATQPAINVDLDPYKYSVSPDAAGTVDYPEISLPDRESPEPYVVEPPKVTLPKEDDCHIAHYYC